MNAEPDLNDKIEAAIAKVTDQVKAQPDAQKALHFSQSALNLAHTKAVLEGLKAPYATKKA